MEKIKISRYNSPVGELMLGSWGDELCMCDWVSEKQPFASCQRICRHLGVECEEGSSEVIELAAGQLDEYFRGQRSEFSVPVKFAGTQFQKMVWSGLLKIPYGTTVSYAELAGSINCPNGVRAVASAIGRNPISIIVPCHRVIGSNRKLTGYAGGLAAKRHLLALEQVSSTEIL